jgi:hypothetical protein
VREESKLSEKDCIDFLVTPNNKYVIVSGKDGLIRVFDYFMRGCNVLPNSQYVQGSIIAQNQSFGGHALYGGRLIM